MLYTYILNREKVKEYFPETETIGEDEESTTVQENLVCIKSNKWVDIPKKDKYVPFVFRSTCDLDEERIELMKEYIESVTETEGIYFTVSKDLDYPGRCIYQTYIGDETLYLTEADSNNLKCELSYFEEGDVFVTSDEMVLPREEQIIKEGIIFSPKGKNIKSGERNYTNRKEIELVFGEHLHHVPDEALLSIENEELPTHTLQGRKLFGFVEKLLKDEDPVHTPYKISKQLDQGGIQYVSYNNLLHTLENVPEVDVKSHVTEDPSVFLLTLRMNEIPFLATENDGICEIIYGKCNEGELIDPQNIDDIITEQCKNHAELKKLTPREKLDILIHDGHGIVINPEEMEYVNRYTGKLLPSSIIHTCGVSWKGFEASGAYDPHRNVHIETPVEIVIENLGSCISILLKTSQEESYLDENFHYCPTMVQEEELKHLVRKLWKKGYLHDDYGLANLIYYGNYKPGHIETPWWFQGKNPKQARDLIRFIEVL